MSYRMYVERHKALDSACDLTEKQYLEATARWNQAGSEYHTADRNLNRGDAETRPERERELLATSDRLDAAVRDRNDSADKRDRTWAERENLERDYPVHDAAFQNKISPSDQQAPSDQQSPGEARAKGMEQVLGVAKAAGIVAHLMTTSPVDQSHIAQEQPTAQEIKSVASGSALDGMKVPGGGESHVSATYSENQPAVPKPDDMEDLVKALGKEEKMTSPGGMRGKADEYRTEWDKANTSYDNAVENAPKRSADDIIPQPQETAWYKSGAEFGTQPSMPDPEKITTTITAQAPPAPASDKSPERPAMPDAEKPMATSDRLSSGGGMPNPDPPASALSARVAANDNQPPSPANDNKPRSPANDNDPGF